jgi:hypothetical protein
VFRYSLRELLLATLVVALGSAWCVESSRGRVWRKRAEIAAGQLESEQFGRMVFSEIGVYFNAPYKDPQLQEVFVPTDSE